MKFSKTKSCMVLREISTCVEVKSIKLKKEDISMVNKIDVITYSYLRFNTHTIFNLLYTYNV